MALLPVVHWHFWSVREQPEAGAAAAKQLRAHEGMSLRSCAEATAQNAPRAMREKRMVIVVGMIR